MRGAGFRGLRAIAIVVRGVIAVLAESLALALVLASPGTAPARADARAAAEPHPDNAARARRGLLPRKAQRARPPSRTRRIVLLPKAPTWLGEPGQLTEPVAEVAADRGAEAVVTPAAVISAVPAAGVDERSRLRASVGAVAVEWLVVRRRAEVIRASVAGPQVAAVMIRRRAAVAP